MPYLLQDLWALGSSVDDIIRLIAELNLPPETTRILDLGCGKGAVLIRLAKTFGFQVLGIDAMLPFLEEANHKARAYKVAHLCKFESADIRQFTSIPHDFDVVILASLGGLFGSLKKTVGILRSQIRADGYIIIDDGYLKSGSRLLRKGYWHYKNHQASLKALTSFGDLVRREINTSEFNKEINREYLQVLIHRGLELAEQHPELEEEVQSYIEQQKQECTVIEEKIEGTLWLLQKRK